MLTCVYVTCEVESLSSHVHLYEASNIESDYWDCRTSTLWISTNFSHSQQLLGMSVQVASIQKHLHQRKNARDLGLVMFGWVDHDINKCEEIHEILWK